MLKFVKITYLRNKARYEHFYFVIFPVFHIFLKNLNTKTKNRRLSTDNVLTILPLCLITGRFTVLLKLTTHNRFW